LEIPDKLGTVAGTVDALRLPVPNWPETFEPQHFPVPSDIATHVWLLPADTDATPVVIFSGPTGEEVDVELALPNWPEALSPQQRTPPVVRTAHVWLPPADTLTAVVIAETAVGAD
jgi:hypothetical protein